MSGKRSSGSTRLIIAAVVGGFGCVGVGLVAVAVVGAGWFAAGEVSEVAPSAAPVHANAPEAELPLCAPPRSNGIQLYLELTATHFRLWATDGTTLPMPYEDDAYPFAALRERLLERRQQEPNRDALEVNTEPGVPAPVAARVLALARETGFAQAVLCRPRTETDDLLDPAPAGEDSVDDAVLERLEALAREEADEARGEDDPPAGDPEGGGSGYGRGAGGLQDGPGPYGGSGYGRGAGGLRDSPYGRGTGGL
jgi:hypothetical protein